MSEELKLTPKQTLAFFASVILPVTTHGHEG